MTRPGDRDPITGEYTPFLPFEPSHGTWVLPTAFMPFDGEPEKTSFQQLCNDCLDRDVVTGMDRHVEHDHSTLSGISVSCRVYWTCLVCGAQVDDETWCPGEVDDD